IFNLILNLGGYGFNKSHITRYAMVAYQTAYMKTYHPVEYMAALLTFESGNTDKVVEYIDECRSVKLPEEAGGGRGIQVLPPDVNASGTDFTPVYTERRRDEETKRRSGRKQKSQPASGTSSLRDSVSSSLSTGVIRFGLTAVRGVGEKAVETIIAEREAHGPFASLFDFCERVDTRSVQRSTIDALVRCGAFGSMHPERAPALAALDRAFEVGQRAQEDKRTGQAALFGVPEESAGPAASAGADALPKIPEFQASELLKFEKELLGFYLSSHPLTEHQAVIDRYTTATTREAMNASEGTEVVIGAMISAVRPKVAKSGRSAGQKWAIVEFEDLDGKIEGMCFAESYGEIEQRYPGVIRNENIVFV